MSVHVSPVLPVVVSLLTATALAALGHHLERWMADALGIAAGVAVTVLSFLLALESRGGRVITWFSGWKPVDGYPIGISFVVDPFGAGTAAFAGLLVTAALVYSIWHFESAGRLFHVLMLLFLAGMEGFCLTGDLFNLFVFFEILSVSAYALTGYKVEERGPIQGAINFAISNTLGSYLLLLGIAILYAHTRALNLAQLGQILAGQPLHGVLIAALVFIVVGLGIKAALLPLHFWLPDAHAVAPTPVSVLFSGIMVELGLFGLARVYWTVFSGVPALHTATFSRVLMGLGMATALWGAAMAFLQPHLKRLLAFSTMSHGGIILIGIAMLRPEALAGSALYLLGHGLAKGGLFMCAGILLSRFRSVDVDALHGKGRALPRVGFVYLVGGLALCDLPPFGTFFGRALIESAGKEAGYHWPSIVALIASAVTGAAILNAGGRIFLGWGPQSPEPESGRDKLRTETSEAREGRFHPGMVVVAGLVVLGALLVGLWPEAISVAVRGAETFADRASYAADVLGGPGTPVLHRQIPELHAKEIASGFIGVGIALALTLFALFRSRLPDRVRQPFRRAIEPFGNLLRALQSGRLADYVTWIAAGAAIYGGFVAWLLR